MADYLNDLYRVGPKKPLGYLPLDTIREDCRTDPKWVHQQCYKKGNCTRTFTQAECSVFGGALYVWHEASLRELLQIHKETLEKHHWATTPKAFVVQVAKELATDPDLQRVIGLAFADKRWS